MQLKIKRSQKEKGLLGKKVHFALQVMADYTKEEKAHIARYKLGSEMVYDALEHAQKTGREWMKNLIVTVDSLEKGVFIECKSLNELIEAEDMIVSHCKAVRNWLAIALTFDGREVVIDLNERPSGS